MFLMTCDILGTGQSCGQTNILALGYLFGKAYKPAYSSATQVTEINTLDQISTEEVIDVSIHIPLKALMIPFKRVSCMVYLNQCSNTIFVLQRSPQKMWSWVFNINTS